MDTGDVPRLQSLFGGGLPQSDLVRTMKHFLACLALCASLSASAQGDNCTVLGIQDLTEMVLELSNQVGELEDSIASHAVLINNQATIIDALGSDPVIYHSSEIPVYVSDGMYRRDLPLDADIIINDAAAMWVLECPTFNYLRQLIIIGGTTSISGSDILIGHPNNPPSPVHFFQRDGQWVTH